jgi:acyl-coenzyme A synthetase/AMP-(fatty) acid ligase
MSAVIRDPRPTAAAHPVPMLCGDNAQALAFDGTGAVTRARFAAHVRGVAQLLPPAAHVVNLCEDRYRFLVLFCAAALRGQVTLLPPSRTRAAIASVRQGHPDSACVGDGDACGCEMPEGVHFLRLPDALPALDGPPLQLDDAAVVAIGFTSGSTGVPKPNAKTWRGFRTSTAQNLAALEGLWPRDRTVHVVATVPPQHMYGMELSVLLPLLSDAAVHVGKPFFPADVAAALRDSPGDRLLVTTPVHLRALLGSAVELPAMAGIVTATAPLPEELAREAEARFGCEVREMFGSTETCVIARRRTARDRMWTPLPGVRVSPQPDGALVEAPHLPAPVALADLVDVHGDGRFRLCGRQADLLEIAGKRASLGDLTQRLLAVPGVRDGVLFQLDEADAAGVRRIAALVVAEGLDEAGIVDALRSSIDPAFLPRRVRRVAALPRNDCGKLPRDALLRMLQADGT